MKHLQKMSINEPEIRKQEKEKHAYDIYVLWDHNSYVHNGEHNLPHFHALYQGYQAVFDMEGELIEGDM